MSWPNVKYFLVKCIKSTTRYWEVLIGIANASSLPAYWNTRMWLDCHLVSWVDLVIYTPWNLYLFTYLLGERNAMQLEYASVYSLLFIICHVCNFRLCDNVLLYYWYCWSCYSSTTFHHYAVFATVFPPTMRENSLKTTTQVFKNSNWMN
jgi:hypothetical protein